MLLTLSAGVALGLVYVTRYCARTKGGEPEQKLFTITHVRPPALREIKHLPDRTGVRDRVAGSRGGHAGSVAPERTRCGTAGRRRLLALYRTVTR